MMRTLRAHVLVNVAGGGARIIDLSGVLSINLHEGALIINRVENGEDTQLVYAEGVWRSYACCGEVKLNG